MITVNGRHLVERVLKLGVKHVWLFCNRRGFGVTCSDTGEQFVFCPFCGDRIGVLKEEKK